jgi:Mrp family chromosome partitioning ATPase
MLDQRSIQGSVDAVAALKESQVATVPLRPVQSGESGDDVCADLMRVQLEAGIAFPAVVAITSATAEDGKEHIARRLAYSFAATGYATLLIDATLQSRRLADTPRGLAIAGIGRLHLAPDVESGKLAVLTLTDPTLRRTTSPSDMAAAIEKLRDKFEAVDILRGRFECVVVSPDAGTSNAFSNAMLSSADAVFVSVAKKRRKTADDKQLIAELESQGSRYMGLVAIDPAIMAAKSASPLPGSETPVLDQPLPGKTSLIARFFRAAIRSLSGSRRDRVAQEPSLRLPETPEPQTTVLHSSRESISIASGQAR